MEATGINTISFMSHINWRPGIGDPTIIGWFTVVAYFTAFLLSVFCAKKLASEKMVQDVTVQYKLWWFVALAMLLLGINKQLDFQTLITDVGKALAKRQGWYEQRRIVQSLFITGVTFTAFFSLIFVWRTFRQVWKEDWLVLVGTVFLFGFIVIRATSFHGVDTLLGLSLACLKINWMLELGGIACILISAANHLKAKSKHQWQKAVQKDIFL